MKLLNIAAAILLFSSAAAAQNKMSKLDSASYAIGTFVAGSLKNQGMTDINTAELAKGIQDALANKPQMSQEVAQAILQSFMQEQAAKQHAPTIEEGKKFLAENKKKKGIITTASGLQYEIIKVGSGEKPKASDRVLTHYHGTLLDGTVFDSSVQRGEPIEFGVGEVIKGWTEALQLMNPGSKYKLYVPYDLAYGERGAGGSIKPYATLVFEVELISFKPGGEQPHNHSDHDGHKH